MTSPRSSSDHSLPPGLALLFAPIHKRAFGVAVGLAAGLLVFLATAIDLLRGKPPDVDLGLLSQYFAGYRVTWPGAFVGWAWGFIVGFVGGWFFAFSRNLIIAMTLFVIRTRADLTESRDFLDHI